MPITHEQKNKTKKPDASTQWTSICQLFPSGSCSCAAPFSISSPTTQRKQICQWGNWIIVRARTQKPHPPGAVLRSSSFGHPQTYATTHIADHLVTHRVVARARAGCRSASVAPDGTGLTAVVQVFVVEQLLCVHANSSTHVKTQFLLEELPLPGQTFLWVYLGCTQEVKQRPREEKSRLDLASETYLG